MASDNASHSCLKSRTEVNSVPHSRFQTRTTIMPSPANHKPVFVIHLGTCQLPKQMLQAYSEWVIPENIHTSPTEEIGN
jgi:hypothetical protein